MGIGSAIKVAGFGIKKYLLNKQNKLFYYRKIVARLWRCVFFISDSSPAVSFQKILYLGAWPQRLLPRLTVSGEA